MAYYAQKHKIGWGLNEKPCDNQKIKNKRSKKQVERKEEKMRKNVWKRFLAAALSAVIVFTSVDASGLVVKAEEGTTTTKTLGEIVATHNEVSDEEKAVLSHSDLAVNETTFGYTSDGKVFVPKTELSDNITMDVNPDTNVTTISVPDYKTDLVTWSALTVTVNNDGTKTVFDKNEENKYVFEGTVEEVIVKYEAYITVGSDEQLEVLNTSYYLVEATSCMEDVLSDGAVEYAEVIEAGVSVIPQLVTGILDNASSFETAGIEVPVDAFNTLSTGSAALQNKVILHALSVDSQGKNPVAFWKSNVETLIGNFSDDNVAAVKDLSEDTCFNTIEEFFTAVNANSALLGEKVQEIKEAEEIVSGYKKALTKYVDATLVKRFGLFEKSLYADKTALIKEKNTLGTIVLPESAEEYDACKGEKIVLYDAFEITRQGTARVITVEVNAYVVEDNKLSETPITKTATIPAKVGEVVSDVKTNSKETVKELLAGIGYGLTGENVYGELDHYKMVEEDVTAIANGVTSNATISFTYKPNEYTVTCTDEEGKSVDPAGKYYYGYVITFPTAEEGSYNYKSEAVNCYQGKTYTVVSDVAFERIKNDTERTVMNENQIAAETYADDLKAQGVKILKNDAVKSTKLIEALDPKDADQDLLISFGEEELTVNPYDDGVNTWIPKTVTFINGDVESEPVEVENGKVALPEEYTNLNVEYVLEIDGVNASKVANIPATLVAEAKTQLDALKSVVGYADDLADVNNIVLNALKTSLENGVASGKDIKATTIEAVDFILNRSNGLINNNGNLILSSIAETYRNKDDSAKLAYYYTGNNAATVRKQVEDIATQLAIVVEDTAAMEYLRTVELAGVGSLDSYITKLVDATDKLAGLGERFSPKNDLIDSTAGTAYTDLLGYLSEAANSNMVGSVTTGDTLYWISTVNATAPDYFNVKVVVKTSTASKDAYVKGFKAEAVITAEDVEAIKDAVAACEEELDVNEKYYTCDPVKDLDALEDTVVTSNVDLVYTWTPKTYTVIFKEVDETEITPSATFSYGSFLINLPSAPAGFEYIYDINGVDVKQTEGHSIKDDFVTLFNDGEDSTATIYAEKINLALKAEEDFFDKLEKAVKGTGISIITEKDATTSRVTSVELAIDATNNASIADGMQKFVMALVKESAYSEYLLGDYVVMGADGITLQGLIDAVIASGINTVDLATMFDADGKVVNNKVLETTFAYNNINEENKVPFCITYNANGASSDRAKLKAGLDKMNKVVVVEGVAEEAMARSTTAAKKPVVVVTVKEPYSRNAYEAYLVAMVLEGRTTFDEIANGEVALKDIVDFEYERLINDLEADSDDITIKTVANTIAKLNKNVDLSEYEETFNRLKKFIFNGDIEDGILGTTGSGSVVYEATGGEKAVNEYNMLGTVAKEVVFEYLDAADLAGMVSDEKYTVAVRVVVEGMGEEYTAAVINDPRELENITGIDVESAKLAGNVINLLTGSNLTVEENAMLIMLAEADTVTLKGNAIVDLNGQTIKSIVSSEGTVVLVDSTYDNDGEVENTLPSNVKDGRITENSSVNDDFYVVNVDGDNLEVVLDADFLVKAANIEMPELKVLACELAFDLIMNNITSGKMVLKREGTSFNLYDIASVDDKENNDIFEFIAGHKDKETLVNAMIDIVNLGTSDNKGLVAFVNDILAELTDFAGLAEALKAEGNVIAEYEATRNPLNVNFGYVEDGDYLTAGVKTNEEPKTFDIKVVVSKDDSELVALCEELAKVVEKCELSVGLTDLKYVNGNLAATGAKAKAEVEVNLVREDNSYAVAFATIVANGLDDSESEKTALIKAVNDWLTTQSKETYDALKKAVNDVTVAQLIKGITSAYNKDFAGMADDLGITADTKAVDDVEAIYHDLLNVLYRVAGIVVNRLGIDGNDLVFGLLEEVNADAEGTGTYRIDAPESVKGVTTKGSYVLIKLFGEFKDNSGSGDPDGPTQPEKPSKPSHKDDKDDKDTELEGTYYPTQPGTPGANTGDANNTTLWIALMGLAIVAVVVAYTIKKRKAE